MFFKKHKIKIGYYQDSYARNLYLFFSLLVEEPANRKMSSKLLLVTLDKSYELDTFDDITQKIS